MLRAGRSGFGHERLKKTARAQHGIEAAQGSGQHDGAGLEVALRPSRDLLALKRADAP